MELNIFIMPIRIIKSYEINSLIIAVFVFMFTNNTLANPNPLMIAHAGGGIDGKKYSNSIEALNLSYDKGFRYFEIDFSWTSDNQLVCLHDWKKRFKLNFGFKTKGPLTLRKFEKLLEKQVNIHPCTLKTLKIWLSKHPDSKIITDVKYENIKAIQHISEKYPELIAYLIPQFYQPSEYNVLKNMGFKNLIWILYQYKGKKSFVKEYAKKMDLIAVSMRASQVKKKWAQQLIHNNQAIFVYTVNKSRKLNKLVEKYGITGIYTDFLPSIN